MGLDSTKKSVLELSLYSIIQLFLINKCISSNDRTTTYYYCPQCNLKSNHNHLNWELKKKLTVLLL